MNSPQTGLKVASVLIGLVGLAHLLRFLAQVQISIAGRSIPVWTSLVAVVACGLLAFWLWRLSLPPAPQAGAQTPPAKF
jgi:protein-S-isoprenylcysteine O-methyltransferase Ste14